MPKLAVVKPQTPPPLAREVEDYIAAVRALHPSGKSASQYGFSLRAIFLPWCATSWRANPGSRNYRSPLPWLEELLIG